MPQRYKANAALQVVATVSVFLTVGFLLKGRPTVNQTAVDRGYHLRPER